MLVRPCEPRDIAGVREIYGHHALHGFGTFDESVPSLESLRDKHRRLTESGFPYLVALEGERLLGFAYASEFRARVAYRYTCEDSIYIAPDSQRRGAGRALLAELILQCEALGFREMLAVIGDSGNAASIGLHAAFAFTNAGVLHDVGFKFGRRVDVVLMQRRLEGASVDTPTPVERL